MFQTSSQINKTKNYFANNKSTDISLTEAQLDKITQSGKFLGSAIGILGKEALINLAVPLAKDILPKLVTKAFSSILDKFERKISGRGAVRAGKWFN